MTKQGQKPIEVGLVLQGGGALGAYEWGAVTALLELMDEAETAGREVALKGVTGVSIGAINAACIVGSHGRADARLQGPQREPDDFRGHRGRCGLGRAHPLPEPSPPPRAQ